MRIINHLKKNWYKYAFETLVVIVGVLIAFTLSEWANSRNLDQKREELKISIQEELLSVRNYSETRMEGIQRQINLISHLTSGDRIDLDSVKSYSINPGSNQRYIYPLNVLITYVYKYDPRSDVYSSAVSDGSLELLESLDINFQLASIYTAHAAQIRDISDVENDINSAIRRHISEEYHSIFETQQMTEPGWWSDETTMALFEKIRNDGSLKFLLAEKIQVIKTRQGTLRATIINIDKVIERMNVIPE